MIEGTGISAMQIINGRPNAEGVRLLAAFTIVHHGLRVDGCQLIERKDGTHGLTLPFHKGQSGKRSGASISFGDLYRHVLTNAVAGFNAMTGMTDKSAAAAGQTKAGGVVSDLPSPMGTGAGSSV